MSTPLALLYLSVLIKIKNGIRLKSNESEIIEDLKAGTPTNRSTAKYWNDLLNRIAQNIP